MSDNMQNPNNDPLFGIKNTPVGNINGDTSDSTSVSTGVPASTDSTDPASLQQVSEKTESIPPEISPVNVVIKKDAPVTQGIVEEEEEKSSNELDTSTTKIEDREEDSESYMDDTVDY